MFDFFGEPLLDPLGQSRRGANHGEDLAVEVGQSIGLDILRVESPGGFELRIACRRVWERQSLGRLRVVIGKRGRKES